MLSQLTKMIGKRAHHQPNKAKVSRKQVTMTMRESGSLPISDVSRLTGFAKRTWQGWCATSPGMSRTFRIGSGVAKRQYFLSPSQVAEHLARHILIRDRVKIDPQDIRLLAAVINTLAKDRELIRVVGTATFNPGRRTWRLRKEIRQRVQIEYRVRDSSGTGV
jgi:hypothetical protein